VKDFKNWCETKGIDIKNFCLNEQAIIDKWTKAFSRGAVNHPFENTTVCLALENQFLENQKIESDEFEIQRIKRISIPVIVRMFRELSENFYGSLSEGNQTLSVDFDLNKTIEEALKISSNGLDAEAETTCQLSQKLAETLKNQFSEQKVGICRLEFKDNSIEIKYILG